jgi:hypothetical protein
MNAKQCLEEMAELESRIAVIYERFATEFRNVADVDDLWDSMSREELQHADLLSRAASTANDLAVAPTAVAHLHALRTVLMQYAERQTTIVHLQDALRVTAEIEEAEVQHLHAVIPGLGPSAAALSDDPAMQHRLRPLLEHAIQLFGTPALRERLVSSYLQG